MRSTSVVCRSVEFGLRAVGLWPGASYAILLRLVYISLMAVFQIFQYQYLIAHFDVQDLSLVIEVLSATMAYSLLFAKLIIFIFNAGVLDEIIARVADDWKECDVSDRYAMTRMAYISRRFSNVIIASYAMSVLFYATGTLMKLTGDNQTDARELILKMELPFQIESTFVYIAVLITQYVHQTSAASMVGVMNGLLLSLVLHVCGQIDSVRQKLSTITPENIGQGIHESIVKKVIIRHQRIISFSKNIEDLFSYIALLQFVSNTILICFLGFLIVISIDVPNGSIVLMKSVLFYFVLNLDAFIFCFVGEYLSTKSKTIGDAAYESLWYNLKPNQNRDLLLMIIRSQKHLTLTIGKFVDLSLKQFGNIVKASASYVSVLHAMY